MAERVVVLEFLLDVGALGWDGVAGCQVVREVLGDVVVVDAGVVGCRGGDGFVSGELLFGAFEFVLEVDDDLVKFVDGFDVTDGRVMGDCLFDFGHSLGEF